MDARFLMLVKGELVVYQSYKDLDIYNIAHKLAIEVHKMSLKLPKFEMYEEKYIYFCEKYDHLGRMITNFIKSVELSHKTKRGSRI